MMKRITTQILAALLLVTAAYAQNNTQPKPTPSKSYWLTYNLICFRNCLPKVLPGNILFTDGCSVGSAYDGEILSRGARVEITSVHRQKGFAKVSFKFGSEYEVLLSNNSEQSFRKSFDLLFSATEVPEEYPCPDEMKTKKQVIQCLGFPIFVEKSGDVEKYSYILEFLGRSASSMGYDGFTVEIKKNKVTDIYGYI